MEDLPYTRTKMEGKTKEMENKRCTQTGKKSLEGLF